MKRKIKKLRPIRGARHPIRGAGGGDINLNGTFNGVTYSTVRGKLRSRAFLRVLDLICEGEISGLATGDGRSIYLDETPLLGDDLQPGTFRGVSYETRNGDQNQSYITGASAIEAETAIGVQLFSGDGNAIVRQITNTDVNRVRIRIAIPALYHQEDDGDIEGTDVLVEVYVQPDGGSYTQLYSATRSGKAKSRYEFDIAINLPAPGPWNVKVVRVTDDASNPTTLQNETHVVSITEIIDAKLTYPNSALIGMRIDSEQFSAPPRRFYDMKLLNIRTPSNYDPETRTYDGEWDGSFAVQWTDNPAWIFYDLATNDRYGLGAFISDDQVDKWGLYEIAQYCDEMVPDGFGGTEPRFTCNMMLADRVEAYTAMQSLASVFRGMIYWAAGAITVVQDSPQDAAYLFTPANVVDGRFTYQGASAKARHTVALVTWNDPEDFYRQKVEYVEDQEGIIRYGVQQAEVTAFGCTSRGQAHRFGKWLLYTEQYESETVTFKTGLDGMVGRPGQVIKIADPARAGVRKGGRISAGATTTLIPIDDDISGSISGNTLSVMLPNGTVEDRTVVGSSGRVIEVQPALSLAPQAQSIWILRSDTVEPQEFRVIGVQEEGAGIYVVTALKHDSQKFDAIEDGLILETRDYSDLTSVPSAPQNLALTESLYQSSAEVKSKITVSWDKVERAVAYRVRWARDNNNFVEAPEVSFNDFEILDTQPGTYVVQVTAINAIGKASAPTEIMQETYGKIAPPGDVEGFSMLPMSGQAYLTWNQTVDLDVYVGGQVRIRHTPLITGQDWRNAVDIIPAVPGSATNAMAPLLSGTYMVKFVDSSGNFSGTASMIVTDVPYVQALNIVETLTEHPAWAGVKTDMIIDGASGALLLASGTLIDDYPEIDDVGSFDMPGGVVAEGTYDFSSTIDLGGVLPSRIITTLEVEAFDVGAVIDSRVDPIDSWLDIDGEAADDVNAEIYVRTTPDDPGASPVWTDWKRVSAAEYPARGFQFQLRATSESDDHSIYIKQLQVEVDMPDRTIHLGPLTSGAGLTVEYPEAFFEAPIVSITILNAQSGDYPEFSNESESGFDIVFKDSSNAVVSRSFSVIAKGYGRRVA